MNRDEQPPIDPPTGRWRNVDPQFDGHLERPLLEMTVQERLNWIDEMMRFRHWARTQLRPADPAGGSSNHPAE
jgi:hypothetical protein